MSEAALGRGEASKELSGRLVRHSAPKHGMRRRKERIGGLPAKVSQVPSTLHGHLFLLAFDPKSRRFDGHDPTLFGFALRAAILTELQLRGYLVERQGVPVPAKAASPDDPVLRAAFAQVGVHNRGLCGA